MKESIIHPGELLMKKYIIPSGKSIYRWENDLGISCKSLRRYLKGRYLFTIPFTEKLAKLTNTNPRYWIRTQKIYLLNQYQKNSKDEPITRIKLNTCGMKRGKRYPGLVLDRMRETFNMSYVQLARYLNICDDSIYRIITGRSKIGRRHAIRLGAIFETGSIYWLDLQSEQDLVEYVSKRGIAFQTLGKQWEINSQKGFLNASRPEHPGEVLLNKFILPTKIRKNAWSHYFCTKPKYLNKILKGKSFLTIKLIASISKAFRTKPEYWIRIQNQFIAWKGDKGLKKTRSNGRVEVSQVSFKNIPPGKILRTSYLKPLNWGIREFAEHIGIRFSEVKNIVAGKKSIDAKIETKLTQALGTPPMFWTDLQIEWDFFKAAKLKGKNKFFSQPK
jgi:addiction module HigA family antidote